MCLNAHSVTHQFDLIDSNFGIILEWCSLSTLALQYLQKSEPGSSIVIYDDGCVSLKTLTLTS